jgi:hypothetical protein
MRTQYGANMALPDLPAVANESSLAMNSLHPILAICATAYNQFEYVNSTSPQTG